MCGLFILILNPRHIQHGHNPVQQSVYDLKASRLITPNRRRFTNIPRLSLSRSVFDNDVGSLEDANGERVRSVLANRLEKARKERGPNDLVLKRFGIGEPHDFRAVICAIEPREILFVRALCNLTMSNNNNIQKREQGIEAYKNKRENFDPTGHSAFPPNEIAELAHGQRLGNRARRWERLWQIVESKSNRRVLHNIALVKNIRTGSRDLNIKNIGVRLR